MLRRLGRRPAPGQHGAGLDSAALSGSDAITVTVAAANQAPTAAFSSPCTGLICRFTDGSSDGDGSVVSWSWGFGDGNASTVQNPSHGYAAGGTYTVTLTVTDDGGTSESASQGVTVSEPASTGVHVGDIGGKEKNKTGGKPGRALPYTMWTTIWYQARP